MRLLVGLTSAVAATVAGVAFGVRPSAVSAADAPQAALAAPVVGMAALPTGNGYWEVAADGGVFSFGTAQFYGSMGGRPLNAPIVGMAATPDGGGYWLVASDGGIFTFGDAGFYGSMGGHPLNAPIVGIAAMPDGHGYWEVASDGGIFTFGYAGFYGSMGGKPLNEPVVGMAALPGGGGYWEVASDGGIFTFGDAGFCGSMGGHPLNAPIVGIAVMPDGRGYWEVASDGGIFTFGDAGFYGSMGGKPLNEPVDDMAPSSAGYWEVATDGGLFTFGNAAFLGSPVPASSALQYGPGPLATYTVQPQPPAGSCHYTYVGNYPLPDSHCTPGALNPQVTQSTIASTICRSGYTSSIRPPESITEPEKLASASAYTYTGSLSTAEYDHLVPLELGGDPNDPANLWVEPNDNPNATSFANSKDVLEDRLNSLVCAGRLSLSSAQDAIASDWVTAYQTYVVAQPSPTPPESGAYCTASAAPANDGYSGDYYVSINSNQPNENATASDASDSWSDYTDASGYVAILLYRTSPGEQINVTVGSASCSTTA